MGLAKGRKREKMSAPTTNPKTAVTQLKELHDASCAKCEYIVCELAGRADHERRFYCELWTEIVPQVKFEGPTCMKKKTAREAVAQMALEQVSQVIRASRYDLTAELEKCIGERQRVARARELLGHALRLAEQCRVYLDGTCWGDAEQETH